MIDADFVLEYVAQLQKLLYGRMRTASQNHMIWAVLGGRRIEKIEWFDDHGVESLYKCPVTRAVYTHIRENYETLYAGQATD